MSVTNPSEDLALVLAAYLQAVCCPLLDSDERLEVEHGPGFGADYTFRVKVSGAMMPFMLGRGGENAEAVRRLARARARAIGWSARVDVRVVST